MIFRKWSVVECRDPGSNTGRTFFACLTQDAEGEIVESNLTHGQAKSLARKLRERDINRPARIGDQHDPD
jgi:hypothetical protein